MRKKRNTSVSCSLALIQVLLILLAPAAFAQSSDIEEADRLNTEARRLLNLERYDEALPLFEKSLALRQKSLGPEHRLVAESLLNLGELHRRTRRYQMAESLMTRSLALFEKALGPEHTDVGTALNNLAAVYNDMGDYAKAEPLLLRALAIIEKQLGPAHIHFLYALGNLGNFYSKTGNYAKAESFFQRAIAIVERARGKDHSDLAPYYNALAAVFFNKGEYAKAEPLFQRALAIDEKRFGPEHPSIGSLINNLGQLYHARGDYSKAEAYYLRARAIFEKSLGASHPVVSKTLNNLGVLYVSQLEFAKAEPLFQRALAIQENALGPNHPDVAAILNNLADLYQIQGGLLKAELSYQRALSIRERAYGADHPIIAETLQGLGSLHQKRGDYKKAEEFLSRAVNISEKSLPPQHPEIVRLLVSMALLYQASGDIPRAISFRSRANEIQERNVALNLDGSERDRLLYVGTLLETTYQTISMHTTSAPKNAAAARMALATVLRRKGLSLDVAADPIASLRVRLDGKDRALLDQLLALRSRLATVMLVGPAGATLSEFRNEASRLYREIEEIEFAIGSRSAQLGAAIKPVTLEAVQALIPAGAALVEFVLYQPYDVKKDEWQPARYVAYILKNQGEPDWVDLGRVEAIDKAVASARNDMRDRKQDPKASARKLDAMVMQPVRAGLGATRTVLLSPDGALNLVPFAALVDEQGKYLIESFSFTYLASGRDLVRLESRNESRQGAVVIADPEFGGNAPAASNRDSLNSQKPARMIDLADVSFPPLPGTAGEAEELKKILPDATLLTKEQATEAAIKRVSGPRILHVATHGFFLDDIAVNLAQLGNRALILKQASRNDEAQPLISSPFLRSGLAMAGANSQKGGGDDDGRLTAYEAAGIDLRGTKLVVLSACDTGLGTVQNGEGVYGLRRSLVIAGAETQVMSLWSVNDLATRDLMTGYYKNLLAGRGRAESLRLVQIAMLKSEGRGHPFFWAPFIQSGEWANLQGKR